MSGARRFGWLDWRTFLHGSSRAGAIGIAPATCRSCKKCDKRASRSRTTRSANPLWLRPKAAMWNLWTIMGWDFGLIRIGSRHPRLLSLGLPCVVRAPVVTVPRGWCDGVLGR